jgi:MFS transporter, FSR family, fosmidomycin resistance protein
MSGTAHSPSAAVARPVPVGATMGILAAISVAHMLNDIMQSVIPAIYPILKDDFALSFTQIGLIQLTFQLTASILQPAVGILTDRRPQPFSLATGMGFTLIGLIMLSLATSFGWLLLSVAMIGVGSSIFHPEASRVARMASGGRHGFAQSLFQVGGNVGSAIGPLLAVLVILGRGQTNIAWFGLIALGGILILTRVGYWYRDHPGHRTSSTGRVVSTLPRTIVVRSVLILGALIFSKFFYMAALTSFYTFYLIENFQVSVGSAQMLLFVFLAAVAAGTFAGGPIGDRFGRKFVIWFSILGVLPMTMVLPHVGLVATIALTIGIGLVLSSAFSAILVYAQELLPGNIGLVSGLFFGFAFGMGGIGAAVLGKLADATSVTFVFEIAAYLPLIGILTILLPDLRKH